MCTRFWWGNLRERDHWGDQYIDEMILLRWIFRKWDGGAGTDLALDRDKWQALVNAVMNLSVPQNVGNLTS